MSDAAHERPEESVVSPTPRTLPTNTYRIQLSPEFGLDEARGLIPYLRDLGVDWIYLSPVLESEPGSDHGYNVVDPTSMDDQRDGAFGLGGLAAVMHAAGGGVLVDIVPNHVGVGVPEANPWWWDVLEHGQDSAYAKFFDIDWAAGGGKLVIPVLGSGTDEDVYAELEHLELVSADDGDADGDGDGDGGSGSDAGWRLRYYDHEYPVAAGTERAGSARAVLAAQHYRLEPWDGSSGVLLNYRRFFAINEMAGVRVEDPEVYQESLGEVARWFAYGVADGLRVDHVDGLADPGQFLNRLREDMSGQGAREPGYLVVEKILEDGEELPGDWPVEGTSGYEALAGFDRVFTSERVVADRAAAEEDWAEEDWAELCYRMKYRAIEEMLEPDFRRLEKLLGAESVAAGRALRVLAASMPVYRTYLVDEPAAGAEVLRAAAEAAVARAPELAGDLAGLLAKLSDPGHPGTIRFQQTTGMVMAKGVEDTAFYRWTLLSSANEVGANPARPTGTVAEFHAEQALRAQRAPAAMTTISTHDTKRSEDARARIQVLGEDPDRWARVRAAVMSALDEQDGSDGSDGSGAGLVETLEQDPVMVRFVLEAAVGIWPVGGLAAAGSEGTDGSGQRVQVQLRDRLVDYAHKAARESGAVTEWTNVDEEYEAALVGLVEGIVGPGPAAAALDEFVVSRVEAAGLVQQVALKFVQLVAPGVPDVYQGTEVPHPTLVDPDNRRAVDFAARRELLDRLRGGERPPAVWSEQFAADPDRYGAELKMLVTWRCLSARRDRPEWFTSYEGLEVLGAGAEHVLAFARSADVIAVAVRLPGALVESVGSAGSAEGPGPELEARIELDGSQVAPGRFEDLISGRIVEVAESDGAGTGPEAGARAGVGLEAAEVLGTYPVALLVRVGE